MPKMTLSMVSVSVPSFLRVSPEMKAFTMFLKVFHCFEGVNECANKLVNGDTQLNDKLYNTDNAGNNTKGGAAWARPSDLRTVALALAI